MQIEYTIKSNKQSKKIRIAVYAGGEVVVTKPVRVTNIQVEMLIQRKMDWIIEKIEELSKKPKKLLAHHSIKDFKDNKNKAFELANKRIAYFNHFYGYEVGRIVIRNQKTRWGSCSRRRNLNFNYKIVFLPEELQDYIIVHELCHLKEMNHSQKFWELVAQKVPNYKTCRKQIKLF